MFRAVDESSRILWPKGALVARQMSAACINQHVFRLNHLFIATLAYSFGLGILKSLLEPKSNNAGSMDKPQRPHPRHKLFAIASYHGNLVSKGFTEGVKDTMKFALGC